jgi:hypothetical protein
MSTEATLASACVARRGLLAPLSIYQSEVGTIQGSWLEDFNLDEQDCFFSSSPSGRTSDEIGSKWLQELFDTRTAAEARRNGRLLFVDGHGDHVTTDFLQKALEKKILIAIYPLHTSRYRLLLSIKLPTTIRASKPLLIAPRGLTEMSQKDFSRVFWPAWQRSFIEANIRSSWKKSGLVPWCPSVILDKFKQQPSATKQRSRRLSSSSPIGWNSPTVRKSVTKAVNKTLDRRTKKLLSKLTDELLNPQRSSHSPSLRKRRHLKLSELFRRSKSVVGSLWKSFERLEATMLLCSVQVE